MPKLPINLTKQQEPQTIFLAVWDHKHGEDVSAHTTRKGAQKQLAVWAREALAEWQDDSCRGWSDEDLVESWSSISGETEFLRVDEILLNEEEPDEKANWAADTSHIGA